VIILRLCAQAEAKPEAARLVTALMRPVMDWARLQEQRKERELAEQKYRDQVEAQKAAIEREINAAKTEGGLSLETIERIERELKLM
jgi:chorismate mutase